MFQQQDRPDGQVQAARSDTHDPVTIAEPGTLLAGALAYSARGWPVFPCLQGGKAPLTPRGFKDAGTDPDQIRAWWRRWPLANVAVTTGVFNGAASIDVVDVDVRPTGSGWAALNRLKRAGLLAGAFAKVATPSGGLHLYFPGTDQRGGTVTGQHIDFKACGGYVVAPPSVVGVAAYELLEESANLAGNRADFDAMRRLLAPPACDRQAGAPRRNGRGRTHRPGRAGAAGLVRFVAEAHEGERNGKLFWAACRAMAEGHQRVCEDLIAAAVQVGLSEAEARRTIASAQRNAKAGAR